MDVLGDLIELITKKRIKKIELFDESNRNKQSNYFRLFEGIHTGKYADDAAAAEDIYGCDPSEKKFLILKTRLKQKLLNTLFFLDLSDAGISEAKRVSYECHRSLFHARALLLNGSEKLAIPTVERTWRQAQEYYLTDVELECLRILKQYASQNDTFKEFSNLSEQTEATEARLQREVKASSYWEECQALFNKSKSNRELVAEMSQRYHGEVKKLLDQSYSPELAEIAAQLQIFYYQLTDQYEEGLKAAATHEAYVLNNSAFYTSDDLADLTIQKLNLLLHLRDYDRGRQIIRQSGQYFQKGEEDWVTLQEYHFLLAMHTEQYTQAAEVFHEVISSNRFRTLPDARKERWKVFQAYLHFIYKNEGLKAIRSLTQNSKTGFKLNDFITDLPEFSKKERGINIAKLTIQTLFHLDKMNLSYLKKCTEEISRYTRRYPKRDINFRSECLIGLMMNMQHEDYRFYQTRKSSEKFHAELSEVNMQYLGGNQGLEVIPYERIWDLVLSKLKDYRYG